MNDEPYAFEILGDEADNRLDLAAMRYKNAVAKELLKAFRKELVSCSLPGGVIQIVKNKFIFTWIDLYGKDLIISFPMENIVAHAVFMSAEQPHGDSCIDAAIEGCQNLLKQLQKAKDKPTIT